MKRFITAMLFSATVIVCQQQTLFAALSIHTNTPSVTADSEEGNRGIPIAGADRLVPVAGANSGLHSMSSPLFRMSLMSGSATDSLGSYVPSGGRFDSSSTSTQMKPDDDMGCNLYMDPNDCPNIIDIGECDEIIDPYLQNNSPLLPWHGR